MLTAPRTEDDSAPYSSEGESLPVRRSAFRRCMVTLIVLAAIFAGVWVYRTSLSAEEARLVGTWELRDLAAPDLPGNPRNDLTLLPDRTIAQPAGSPHHGTWKIVRGRLTLSMSRSSTVQVFGVTLPWKDSGTLSFRLVTTTHPDRYELRDTLRNGNTESDIMIVRK